MFGASGGARGGLAYADESTLAYLAGHSLVLYQTDTRTQRFVQAGAAASAGGSGAEGGRPTGFAVCPAKHLLALAERGGGGSGGSNSGNGRATVTVYDLQTLKRRKILTAPGEGTKVPGLGWEMLSLLGDEPIL